MSKGNMLLGHARGKVGSLVFSRANGKQIVRAKAEVVANPQTEAQMIQRIFLNTISQAYSGMSEIVDHSFEGVKAGQASMSFFMQKNLKRLRERVSAEIAGGAFNSEIFSFSPIGTSLLVPNDYLISKGTLPVVQVQDNNADDSMKVALSANTYAAIIADYGLQRGDQLTFVAMTGNSADDAVVSFCRVILDPRNADGTEAPLTSEFITNGAINLPSERNEGQFVTISFAGGALAFGFGSTYMLASAVIVSRKNEAGDWKRSTAYMTANESSAELKYNLQYCLDALAEGAFGTLNNRYLNNAGASRLAQDGSVERVTISVTVDPANAGTVTGAGTYRVGDQVTLVAGPAQGGAAWGGWKKQGASAYISTDQSYTFTAAEDLNLVAAYDGIPD